ncbi:hypothetical protein B9Z35_02285 [Limnohabitans sp. Jir61]|nr:hypothetical protein B9Z35_02285 [Limnohabitans sp. Jir61]
MESAFLLLLGANCARLWFVYKLTTHQHGEVHIRGAHLCFCLHMKKASAVAGFGRVEQLGGLFSVHSFVVLR